MSFDVNWDIDKYREDHECDDHWQLRRAFMERWRSDYPEERLVCLARVFANIEFMGCRYPTEVMQEISRLSQEVAKSYRNTKKSKLQRTFVSASDAAEDRAKGVKREGGVITSDPSAKSSKISFVKPGQNTEEMIESNSEDTINTTNTEIQMQNNDKNKPETREVNNYLTELMNVQCVDVRSFREDMFNTSFGKLIMLVRPWAGKMWNIQASCQACNISLLMSYERGCFTLTINGELVAQANGPTKAEAKSIVENMTWNRLREEVITVVVKEQWIAQNNSRISVSDVAGKREEFGTPVENSVATKMMKMMGWKGGGLGADAQGISEPIRPNLQMINRAGLGSVSSDARHLRRAAHHLLRRYLASDTLDVDLVFTSQFSKEERALLHKCAQQHRLNSKSYGDVDSRLLRHPLEEMEWSYSTTTRPFIFITTTFLVISKKLDPFSLVRAVIEKGGNTAKYQVFIPHALMRGKR